ncbi:MAG: Prephenate dehydratase [Candidatus Heimdallarchaeota archaeon LC_3]|nr:MAG: Prephenate dehydratase [Candidatus Heimdallarchaeota archaeon LC_3]
MKIAIQGDIGSFSYVIATQLSGSSISIDSCDSFKEVFNKIRNKQVDKGIIPIENALTGRIGETVKLLMEEDDFKIVNEAYLEINHYLLARSTIPIENLKEIYGHPEALSQCKKFLSNLPAKKISYIDGAKAFSIVSENDELALIASVKMHDLFNLEILCGNIQDEIWNQTRFFVIENIANKITINTENKNKTSIIISTNHIPGALYRVLSIFAENEINLTKLESIPSRKNLWEYIFLLDFEGHTNSEIVQDVLFKIKGYTNFIKILGSYPLENYPETRTELEIKI